jgi:HAD superfamily hydrolase (TIGR01509 family)
MSSEAIFWDNDGVLVDTEHLYFKATQEILASRGVDLTPELYLQWFLQQNRGINHFADARGWSEDELKEIRRERGARYAELLHSESCVLPGVEEVLAALHGRCRMAIVTSARREHFDIIHAQSGLLKYFEFVLAAGDYSESKPHPAPYLKAVERAGIAKDNCLVIEDTERGLASAIAAGLKCVIVPSRLTAGRPFAGAHRVLKDIREVLLLV